MGLEATMIIVDNSDWARNGDFYPSRWEAQEEAANIVAQAKCQENVESAVGLMLMAGRQADILVTPIPDPGRILTSFENVKLGGGIHLSTALQIAQLALKHRLNKNQKQRIIVFVASPVKEDEKALETLGKKLKKNGVAVDVVNMEASDAEQNQKLQRLVEAVNSADNSHYVEANAGIQQLSDFLISTPILSSGDGGAVGGIGNDFGGAMDPELEMAIRISLEEEKERNRKKEEEEKKKTDGKIEEEKPAPAQESGMKIENEDKDKLDELDEEELMRRATELSLQEHNAGGQNEEKKKEGEAFQDPNFVNDLLNSIPGIDQNDPEIMRALEQIQKGEDKKDEKKDEKK